MLSSQDMRGVTIQIICFGIAVSILYLLGYWSTFGINVFEYANFKDIIIVAGISMSSGLVFYIIGCILGVLISPDEEPEEYEGYAEEIEKIEQKLENYKIEGFESPEDKEQKLEEITRELREVEQKLKEREEQEERDETRRERFLYLIFGTKIGLFIYWIAVAIIGFVSFPYKTFIFALLFAQGSLFLVWDSEFLYEIKSTAIRRVLIMTLFFAIGSSYFFGKDQAKKVLDNGPKTFYEVGSRRKYLGHTNGYFFLLSPDNSEVTIIRSKFQKNLVLTRDK